MTSPAFDSFEERKTLTTPGETLRLPRLTIAGADSVAPSLPDAADPEVQVWRDHDGTICAYGHTDDEVHWMHMLNLASFRFGGGGEDGVTAIPQRLVREDRILGVYYRTVLPIVLQARGQEALHASAVLTPKGVVALCATSGTGKSTTAFGLSQRGWPLWADDAVAFQTLGTGVKTVPLPFDLRLLSDATAHFEPDPTTVRTDSNGNGVDLAEQEPVPLAALLLLSRAHDGEEEVVRIRRLSAAEAFIDVLTQAYCFNPRDEERKRSMAQHYLDLVARVPVFEIRFQPGLERLPMVLDSIGLLVHRTLGDDL